MSISDFTNKVRDFFRPVYNGYQWLGQKVAKYPKTTLWLIAALVFAHLVR